MTSSRSRIGGGGPIRPGRRTDEGVPTWASWLRIIHRVGKTRQIGRDCSATLAAMTVQTIPEYLEEEREKATDNQLRTEEEAARIQLQHGHHRAAKQSRLQLVAPIKAATKKRMTAAVAPKKRHAAGKTAAKKRKKAVGKVGHRAGARAGSKKPSHKRTFNQGRS